MADLSPRRRESASGWPRPWRSCLKTRRPAPRPPPRPPPPPPPPASSPTSTMSNVVLFPGYLNKIPSREARRHRASSFYGGEAPPLPEMEVGRHRSTSAPPPAYEGNLEADMAESACTSPPVEQKMEDVSIGGSSSFYYRRSSSPPTPFEVPNHRAAQVPTPTTHESKEEECQAEAEVLPPTAHPAFSNGDVNGGSSTVYYRAASTPMGFEIPRHRTQSSVAFSPPAYQGDIEEGYCTKEAFPFGQHAATGAGDCEEGTGSSSEYDSSSDSDSDGEEDFCVRVEATRVGRRRARMPFVSRCFWGLASEGATPIFASFLAAGYVQNTINKALAPTTNPLLPTSDVPEEQQQGPVSSFLSGVAYGLCLPLTAAKAACKAARNLGSAVVRTCGRCLPFSSSPNEEPTAHGLDILVIRGLMRFGVLDSSALSYYVGRDGGGGGWVDGMEE